MKIAIVHDWLTGMRGGEKVLEEICRLLKQVDIYTLLYVKGSVSSDIESHTIYTSPFEKLPFVKNKYRYYLPVMPFFIEKVDCSSYDIVISISHCVAKGIRVGKNTLHICYSHTPMRYIWDKFNDYFSIENSGVVKRAVMSFVRPYLQKWDVKTASNVDYFLTNSKNIRSKIQKYYHRDAVVVYPPVDIERYRILDDVVQEDFYLIVSAFAPYKKIDLAVKAFNRLGRPLKIIGKGQDAERIKNIAHSNIEFLGWMSDDEILRHYNKCRALIFPGEEDFGIVPVEVQACGRPVIAYGKGGILETVEDGISGVLFNEQTEESLIHAVERFEHMSFDRGVLRDKSMAFSYKAFDKHFMGFLDSVSPDITNSI